MERNNELLNSFNDKPCENNGIIVAVDLNVSAGVTGAPPQTAIANQVISASYCSSECKSKWGEGSELIEEWRCFLLSSTPFIKSRDDTRIKGLENEKIESVAQSDKNNNKNSAYGVSEVSGLGQTWGNYNGAISYSLLTESHFNMTSKLMKLLQLDVSCDIQTIMLVIQMHYELLAYVNELQDECSSCLVNDSQFRESDFQPISLGSVSSSVIHVDLAVDLLSLSTHNVVSAYINGNNGESTNTDDLDNVNAYHNRKRVAKEANNKKIHAKPPTDGKHGKVKYGPKEDVQMVVEEPNVITYYSVGPCTVPGAVYQDRSFQPTLSPLIDGYEIIPLGVELDCCVHGVGWYGVSSNAAKNTKHVTTAPPTDRFTLDGYRFLTDDKIWVEKPTTSYYVYTPLFTELHKRFKASKLDQPLLNALNANCKLGLTSTTVEDSTLAYLIHLIHLKYYSRVLCTDSQVLVANNAQYVSKVDSGYANSILSGTSLQDFHMPMKIMDAEYQGEVDWKCRQDFEVLKKYGDVEVEQEVLYDYKIYKNSEQKIDQVEEIRVKSNRVRVVKMKKKQCVSKITFTDKVPAKPRHRTRYFTFKGSNQAPLVEYSNSANNLNHGLKRLLACRGTWENELKYRQNAIRLGKSMAKRFRNWHSCTKMEAMLKGKRTTPEYTAHEDKFTEEKDTFIGDCLNDILIGCSRSYMMRAIDNVLNSQKWLYHDVYRNYLTEYWPLLSRQAIAELPHIKRMLRRAYVNGSLLESEENLLVQHLEVHIKRELAKFSKVPRLFMGYGAGCVYAPELPEFVKSGIDGKHFYKHYHSGEMYMLTINIMAKPKPNSLDEIFTDLYDATRTENSVYVAIYSDDSVYAGQVNGVPFCFNGDVSSNDSSQDVPAFLLTYLLLANFHERRAWNLVKQCMLPINISSPTDPSSKLTVEFNGPFEGSGTTLTTVLNHVGSVFIALSFFYDVVRRFPETDIENLYVDAAAYVGHLVTVDSCMSGGHFNFNHVQFLKRSPYFTKDGWKSFTNLGAIFKNFGDVDDDLQHTQLGVSHAEFCSMPHSLRADKFFSGVIRGWKHEPTNPIMAAMRARFVSDSIEVKHDSLNHIFTETYDTSMYDCTEAILSRYGLTTDELNELAEQIMNCKVGHHYSSTAVAKIMEVDYGVGYV